MSEHIEVRCEKCNHTIKAPKTAAGKRGKCPHCKSSVYVPTPEDELDEIPLAPLKEGDVSRSEDDFKEVEAELRRQREEPAGKGKAKPVPGRPVSGRRSASASKIDLNEAIVEYLAAMGESKLDRAGAMLDALRADAAAAQSKVQQLLVDTLKPSKLVDMPTGLYQGLLRKLQKELEE